MNVAPYSLLTEISGRRRPFAIINWLNKQRIPYMVGADGKPKVSEEIIIERIGGSKPVSREPQLRLRHG